MNKSFIFIIILLVLLPFASASSLQYNIDDVNKDIVIQEDASVLITENIAYNINDYINGVYRVVYLSGNQSISDISVETPGYYNTVEIINSTDNVTIKVWLYEDEAKTQKISPSKVNVIYHYTFNKGVKIYDDIAEFQYFTWSNQWDSDVNSLEENIHIPGNYQQTEYWNNPQSIVNSSSWTSEDTLNIKFNKISSHQTAQQRILMPKEFFTSTVNADVIHKQAKNQIEKDQQFYAIKQLFKDNFGYICAIISSILISCSALIYFKYGINPRLVKKDIIQSQIPSKDKPLLINMLLNGNIGEVNADAFNATVLDLINRKYFKIVYSNESDTVIKKDNVDLSRLKQYEVDVYNFISQFKNEEGFISFNKMLQNQHLFDKFMNAWIIDTNHEVTSLDIRKYYDDTGSTYSVYLSYISFITSIILIFLILFVFKHALTNIIGIIFTVILLIWSIVLFVIPNTIMGKWTDNGIDFHDSWINFKKYLKDYSLIKEYPPASIQVWGENLVYATALGCAQEVQKNMIKYFKNNNFSDELLQESGSVFLSYNNIGFRHMFFTGVNTNINNNQDLPGSFGDIGDPGSGGFGGGGGGVF